MPVLNIAQNVYTPSPIRSAMAGKAARIALESQKLQNTAMEQEIGAFDEREARAREGMEIQKQNAQVALQRAQTEYLKMLNESADDVAEKHKEIWARSHIQYQGAMEQGNEDVAAKILEEALRETGDDASDEEIQSAMQMVGLVGPESFFRSQYAAASKSSNATIEAREHLYQNMTPEEVAKAKRVEAGVIPRPVANANMTIAGGGLGVPGAEEVGRVAGTVKGGERAGAQAIDKSGEAMDQLGQVRKSIKNIDEAISALDKGAETGAIVSRLPSVKAASIMLNNIQSSMALDIVGATTFGSLSESELEFALRTALPDNMREKDLKEWLQNKRSAQEKLAAELEAAAIFLGTPGNTSADYLRLMRENGELEFKEDEAQPDDGIIIKAHPQFGDVTEEDIQQTMRDTGRTREEVMELLNGG